MSEDPAVCTCRVLGPTPGRPSRTGEDLAQDADLAEVTEQVGRRRPGEDLRRSGLRYCIRAHLLDIDGRAVSGEPGLVRGHVGYGDRSGSVLSHEMASATTRSR